MYESTPTSIYERPTSSFPLSISSGLAMESLFDARIAVYDSQRLIPKRIDLNQYQTMWINVWTLYRNLVASINKSTFLMTSSDDLAHVLMSEIEVIESLFRIEGLNLCQPIFYASHYKDLNHLDPRIKLRQDKTELQLVHRTRYQEVLKILLTRLPIRVLNTQLMPETRTNSLILTHVPYDLLSHSQFSRLDLLESNTGKLKTRAEWNSKYQTVVGADLRHLPFLKLLLFVFGDRVMIHPMDVKLRRFITEVAEQRHWTPATTATKVLFDLEIAHLEPYVLQFLKIIH